MWAKTYILVNTKTKFAIEMKQKTFSSLYYVNVNNFSVDKFKRLQ